MTTSNFLKTALAFAMLISSQQLNAQDIHFSQFNQAPLTLNPSLAGTTVWIRAAMQYRTQWRAVTDPYKTLGFTFDVKSKKRWVKIKNATARYRQSGDNGFGWGVNFFQDKAGDGKMRTLQANLSGAYQIMMNRQSMIAVGFQGGIVQRSIHFNELIWGSQYDVNSPTGYNTNLAPDMGIAAGDDHFIVPDLSAGGIYSYKRNERYMRGNDQFDLTLGAALFHVNRPKYSFLGTEEKLSPRMVIHGAGIIGIKNTSLAIAPGFMFEQQGPNHELLIGGMVRYMLKEDSKYTGYIKASSVSGGGYYRSKDAFIATALYEFSSYAVGISYDFNVSGLKTVSSGRGGFEITLRFMNPSPFIYSRASFNN